MKSNLPRCKRGCRAAEHRVTYIKRWKRCRGVLVPPAPGLQLGTLLWAALGSGRDGRRVNE